MDKNTFLENFGVIAGASNGIQQLRKSVLRLAVAGLLIEQDSQDGSPKDTLAEIAAGAEARKASGDISSTSTSEASRGNISGIRTEGPHVIPDTWLWLNLKEVGAIVGGATPSTSNSKFWSDSEEIPWITPADMRSQDPLAIFGGKRFITKAGLEGSSAQTLPTRTVLFSSRAPIGHVGITGRPMATNQGFKSCVPFADEMCEWIYLFLLQAGPDIDANATGTTFKEVSGKQVSAIQIPVPPLAEQKRIVVKVNALMALCDELEAEKTKLETLRTAARDSAIDAISTATTPDELSTAWSRISNNWNAIADSLESIGKLRLLIISFAVKGLLTLQGEIPDSEHVEPFETSTKLDESKLWLSSSAQAEVPRGWRRTPMGTLGKWGSGGTPTSTRKEFYMNGTIPWVVIGDLNEGALLVTEKSITDKALAESSATMIPKGSVLIAMYGASIGKTAITAIECTSNQAIAHCSPGPQISGEYLLLLAKSLKSELIDSGQGAAQPNISQTVIKHLLVDVPPLRIQHEIVGKVEELMTLCDALEANLILRTEIESAFAGASSHLLTV